MVYDITVALETAANQMFRALAPVLSRFVHASVHWADAETACTDGIHIYLPRMFEGVDVATDMQIAIGLLAHELCHFMQPLKETMVVRNEKRLAAWAENIALDIQGEALVQSLFPGFAFPLQVLRQTVRNAKLEAFVAAAADPVKAPQAVALVGRFWDPPHIFADDDTTEYAWVRSDSFQTAMYNFQYVDAARLPAAIAQLAYAFPELCAPEPPAAESEKSQEQESDEQDATDGEADEQPDQAASAVEEESPAGADGSEEDDEGPGEGAGEDQEPEETTDPEDAEAEPEAGTGEEEEEGENNEETDDNNQENDGSETDQEEISEEESGTGAANDDQSEEEEVDTETGSDGSAEEAEEDEFADSYGTRGEVIGEAAEEILREIQKATRNMVGQENILFGETAPFVLPISPAAMQAARTLQLHFRSSGGALEIVAPVKLDRRAAARGEDVPMRMLLPGRTVQVVQAVVCLDISGSHTVNKRKFDLARDAAVAVATAIERDGGNCVGVLFSERGLVATDGGSSLLRVTCEQINDEQSKISDGRFGNGGTSFQFLRVIWQRWPQHRVLVITDGDGSVPLVLPADKKRTAVILIPPEDNLKRAKQFADTVVVLEDMTKLQNVMALLIPRG